MSSAKPGTVNPLPLNHLGLLLPKLGVVNRTQAAARAIEMGLVDAERPSRDA